jgi:hypothetical protein
MGPVTLRDEEGAGLAGGIDSEPVPVDETHPSGKRIDPQAIPDQIDEGDGRDDLEADRGLGPQQLHGSFRDEWRPRDGVEDPTVALGGGDERGGDRGVDLVEGCGPVVDVVEGDGIGHDRGRRVTAGT